MQQVVYTGGGGGYKVTTDVVRSITVIQCNVTLVLRKGTIEVIWGYVVMLLALIILIHRKGYVHCTSYALCTRTAIARRK